MNNREKSDRVEEIFAQAADLPKADRPAFLAKVCGGDELLRARVEKLLAAEARLNGFMDQPTIKAEWSPESDDSAVRSVIGPYKLLQKIGEGGFGVVFMAEQLEPVIRKVAFKIIKLGMDTRNVIARFEAERQALALMDHPNIAKVLDAGATETGRPYFVMDLVRGIPITQFCNENKLSTEAQLRLFCDVCSAVQHAHQKGIIHRDLKPNNILVTMNADQPLAKVIDFGIAKATQGRLTDKTLFTQFQQFIGTPAYMSPEQAQMSAVDVDTRSDIYSLGVLLYELLTGSTPFDAKELVNSGLDEMRRIIREQEPVLPSTRLTQLQRSRGHQLSTQRSRIENDLDWIVMKAMEKDRARRYETANGLAQDVKRFLDHEPVSAVAPSSIYQLKKFTRRHKTLCLGGASVVASLVLGLGLAIFAFVREHAAKTEADNLRNAEAEQRQKAEANELRVRKLQYAADMRLALLAVDQKKYAEVKRLLQSHVPSEVEADLRGWEWRYLWNQIREDALVTKSNSTIPAASLSVSPDGAVVAIGRLSGEVQILDAHTLELLRTVQHQHESTESAYVTFVPNSSLLAITVWREELDRPETQLWDTHTWSMQRTIQHPKGNSHIRSVAASPDGTWVATLALRGVLQVHSVETGEKKYQFSGLKPGEKKLAFSPDSRRLVAVRQDQLVIFDLAERDELAFDAPGLECIAFSPDGSIIAVNDQSEGISLRDSETGELVRNFPGNASKMRFLDDGNTLVTSVGPTISVWDTQAGTITKTLTGINANWQLAVVVQDDAVITTAEDGSVSRWSLSAEPLENQRTVIPDVSQVVTFSGPKGNMIATMSDDSIVMGDWRGPDGLEMLKAIGHDNDWAVSWSPEKQILAVYDKGTQIKVWSDSGGILAAPEHRPDVWPRSRAFVDDGDIFVTLDSDFQIVAWDTDTWERADDQIPLWKSIISDCRTEAAKRGKINGIAASPDGRLLAVWANKGYVTWYDLETGTLLADELCHSMWPQNLVFSANGKVAASSGYGPMIVLWQTEPLKILHTIRGVGFKAALSPDGSRLLTALGSDCQIWDVETRRQLIRLDHEIGAFSQFGFTPDGNGIFAISRENGGLHVWEPTSLAEIDQESFRQK